MTPTTVAVIGAGNTGSFALGHLARLPEIGRILIVDDDHYDRSNLVGQDIVPSDVGRPKVLVQARRLRRIAPHLRVEPIKNRVERVPLGRLRADIILGCVDSRETRRVIGELAWHMGVPWVDSGVQGEQLLARVNVYVPNADAPCIQCQWSDEDYNLLEQTYPCATADTPATPAPTGASSALGALAGALQVIECAKILRGETAGAAIGREVLVDAAWHRHYVTTLRRNPDCRFTHETWRIEPLGRPAAKMAAAALLAGRPDAALLVDGRRFVTSLSCRVCGTVRGIVRLADRLGKAASRCRRCHNVLTPRGFDLRDRLTSTDLPARGRHRSLAQLGLQAGDVITVAAPEGERHFQL